MIEFIREIQKMFSPLSALPFVEMNSHSGPADSTLYNQSTFNFDQPGGPQLEDSSAMGRLVSFEMFHRIAIRTQYSLSRRHSRLLWILMCCQNSEGSPRTTVHQFLPVLTVCRLLPDLYLQSVDNQGTNLFPLQVSIS